LGNAAGLRWSSMIRGLNEMNVDPPDATLLRVLQDVAARRLAGEEVSDGDVLSAHPHLMPQLREKLAAMRVAEEARQVAAGSTNPLPDTVPDLRSLTDRAALRAAEFDRYTLHEVVGRGAMGIVYRATQSATGREVAVKVMHQEPFADSGDHSRFEREAHILVQLRHPNIVTVYDTGWVRGCFYLVMDYVSGEPLQDYVARSRPAVREKLALFAGICDAMHAAHLRGVIHRDLKPSNIRVDGGGEPHLLDFGLAKMTAEFAGPGGAEDSTRSMTMTGQFIGSLPWASPEQAEGAHAKIDVRTDVYALGVIIYQMLTGQFPYSVGGNLRDVLDRILTAEPQRPSACEPRIDDEVETIVLKCLSKERERRYQSAGELAHDVRAYLAGEPIAAKRDSTWYVLRKIVKRNRLATGAGAGALLLIAGVAVVMSMLYHQSVHEADRARQTLRFLQDTLFQASSHRLGGNASLKEVLNRTAAQLDERFADEPQIRADLHYTIGSAYETIWQKQKAAEQLRAALELNRRARGPDHPETVRTMSLLAMVLAECDEPAAVDVAQETVRIRRRAYADDPVLLADALHAMAYSLWRAGRPPRWEEAERVYHEALSLYEASVGAEHTDVARMLHGLAEMQRLQGRTADGLALLRRSLAIYRKNLGEEHQFTIECMDSIAGALLEQGDVDEAERLWQQVAARAPRLFGRSWLPMLNRARAAVHVQRGEYDDARRELIAALDLQCSLTAEEHPEQALRLAELSGKLDAAVDAAELDRAYVEAARFVGDLAQHPRDTVRALVALATLRGGAGWTEAEAALLEVAVEVAESGSEETYLGRGFLQLRLGELLATMGRADAALPHLSAACDHLAEVFGPLDVRAARACTRAAELATH